MKRAQSHKEHLARLDLAVQVEDVTIIYNERPILWDIDLQVPAGVTMALVGPNKGGKSTLLKAIAGLVTPLAGDVYTFARKTGTYKNDVAYIPERYSVNWIFPLSVIELVIMGSYNRLSSFLLPKKSDRQATEIALKQVGLFEKRYRNISDLTQGEQVRALVARALVQDARIFLMDEPFISADYESENIILEILQYLKQKGKTVIVAHHDMMTIPKCFDWVAFLNVRKIASGKLSEVFNEANIRATYGEKESFIKTLEVES